MQSTRHFLGSGYTDVVSLYNLFWNACLGESSLTLSGRGSQDLSVLPNILPNTHSSDMSYYKYIFWYLFSSLNSRVEVLEDKGCVSFISISSAYGIGAVRSRWLENVF